MSISPPTYSNIPHFQMPGLHRDRCGCSVLIPFPNSSGSRANDHHCLCGQDCTDRQHPRAQSDSGYGPTESCHERRATLPRERGRMSVGSRTVRTALSSSRTRHRGSVAVTGAPAGGYGGTSRDLEQSRSPNADRIKPAVFYPLDLHWSSPPASARGTERGDFEWAAIGGANVGVGGRQRIDQHCVPGPLARR
jgi:hypothetical protein